MLCQQTLASGETTLRFDDTVDFVVSPDATDVRCDLSFDASLSNARHLLVDQLLPRVLAHKGEFVVHASGVSRDEKVVLFMGPSGAGKSTTAAALANRGFTFLGDDCFVLQRGADGVSAYASYPSLRLLPDSVTSIYGSTSPLLETAPVAPNNPKLRVLDLANAKPAEPVTIGAIVILNPTVTSHVVELSPVRQRDAVVSLVANNFRLHVNDPKTLERLLDDAAAVASSIPVHRLTFPHGFSTISQVEKIAESLLG